jgi:hypothetical protein
VLSPTSTSTTTTNNKESSRKEVDDDNVDEDGDDAATYLHNLYYDRLEFLKTANDLLADIVYTASSPDIISRAEDQLEDFKKSLKRWEGLREVVALVEAFNIIKNNS